LKEFKPFTPEKPDPKEEESKRDGGLNPDVLPPNNIPSDEYN